MTKKTHDIMGIPPQFHEDGQPQYPAPPDEYNRSAPVVKAVKDSSRLRRVMLLLGAAGLTIVGILFHRAPAPVEETISIEPGVIAGPVSEIPSFTPSPSGIGSDAVIRTPAPTEEPVPTATEVVSVEEPGADILFFVFSSQYHLRVDFHDPNHLVRSSFIIRDKTLDTEIVNKEILPDELVQGHYELEPFWIDPFYLDHFDEYMEKQKDPDLFLQFLAVYETAEGQEITITKELDPVPQLGWTVSYDAPYLTTDAYVYPDCFSFRTFEQEGSVPVVAVNDPSAVASGAINISISVNGQSIPAENAQTIVRDDTFTDAEGNTRTYYSLILILARPAAFPEHGTAHVTVSQKLDVYDQIVVFEQDISY